MRAETTIQFPVLWGLQQAVAPVLTLIVVVWLASHAMTVRWAWEDEGPTPTVVDAELMMPVRGVSPATLTDSYHDARSGGRTHHAIDIFAPLGTPVVAAAEGTVVRRSTESLGGRAVYVRTPDSSYVHYYAHLSRFAPDIEKGAHVDAGDVLGYVGTSGNATTTHLHFAVWRQTTPGPPYADDPVNPYPLLTE